MILQRRRENSTSSMGPGDTLSLCGPIDPYYPALPMKPKNKCCFKFEAKAKACKECPLMAAYSKKKRKKKLAKIKKKIGPVA